MCFETRFELLCKLKMEPNAQKGWFLGFMICWFGLVWVRGKDVICRRRGPPSPTTLGEFARGREPPLHISPGCDLSTNSKPLTIDLLGAPCSLGHHLGSAKFMAISRGTGKWCKRSWRVFLVGATLHRPEMLRKTHRVSVQLSIQAQGMSSPHPHEIWVWAAPKARVAKPTACIFLRNMGWACLTLV